MKKLVKNLINSLAIGIITLAVAAAAIPLAPFGSVMWGLWAKEGFAAPFFHENYMFIMGWSCWCYVAALIALLHARLTPNRDPDLKLAVKSLTLLNPLAAPVGLAYLAYVGTKWVIKQTRRSRFFTSTAAMSLC